MKESTIHGSAKPFLEFEVLSFTPIDRNLIDVELLDEVELKWLNDYHAEVKRRVLPHVDTDVQSWLEKACAP